MKIKVLGCSACKMPYDFSAGIKYDESKCFVMVPLCKKDIKHNKGYDDELIEIEVIENNNITASS